MTLILRVPAPARRQRAIEQRILQRFLRVFYGTEAPAPLNANSETESTGVAPIQEPTPDDVISFAPSLISNPTPATITQP